MANVIQLNGSAPSRGEGILDRFRTALAEYRAYRELLGELNALSDRELADIGVSRFNIEEIARGGARRR